MTLPDTHAMIRLWRLSRLTWHLAHGMMATILLLPRLSEDRRQQRIRQWSADFLRILGIRVIVHGAPPDETHGQVLFVANHISWIDIWAIKQMHPVNFVAKSEVRRWPVIGWLAAKVGTLFIERARRHDTGRTANDMAQGLREGQCLCLFPEGTTTNGTELKPFKTGLFQAAIDAEATVWPIALRYPRLDGSANTEIAYDGDITLLQSLRAVLRQREIRVELHFAQPLDACGQERRHLSHQARHAISSLLHLPPHKAPDTPVDPPDASR